MLLGRRRRPLTCEHSQFLRGVPDMAGHGSRRCDRAVLCRRRGLLCVVVLGAHHTQHCARFMLSHAVRRSTEDWIAVSVEVQVLGTSCALRLAEAAACITLPSALWVIIRRTRTHTHTHTHRERDRETETESTDARPHTRTLRITPTLTSARHVEVCIACVCVRVCVCVCLCADRARTRVDIDLRQA